MTKRRAGGRRRARGTRLWSALLLAAASAVLPGLAHLWAGRRGAALLLFGGYVSLGGAVCAAVLWRREELIRLAVQPRWLIAVLATAVLLAVAWAMIVLRSYLLQRPEDLGPVERLVGRVGVTALCLVVCAPFLLGARYAYVQHDLVTDLFSQDGSPDGPDRSAWRGMDRVNVLLLGSDAAEERYGVRTDSIHLASIDTRTGQTVLISLPRNLEDVPFPAGPLRQRFPNGFDGLLFGVYQYAVEHPQVAPRAPNPGAELAKRTVSEILDLPVHYYALVDLGGFREIVNAMGGVHLCIPEPIPYGHRGKVVEAGCRTLDGGEALWYGRSRTFSSDYARMGRQRCLIGAMVQQAKPVTVLRNYQGLAQAVKTIFETDVPQSMLPEMVDLALRAKDAEITSLQLVPPLISPAYADYPRIQRLAHQAVRDAEQADAQPAEATTSAPPDPGGSGPVPAPHAPPQPGPGAQPGPNGGPGGQSGGPGAQGPGSQEPGGQRGTPDAVSLDAACP